VYRGAFGTAISVPIRDLVVGDIVQICQGDRVPADCIILDEMNLVVDESIYGKRFGSNVNKEESQFFGYPEGVGPGFQDRDLDEDIDNHKSNPDFVLLSDSKVMRGEGRAIVCAVGEMTKLSRKRTKDTLVIGEENTLLEQKLDIISKNVAWSVYTQCFGLFVILIVYNTLHALFSSEKELFSNETMMGNIRIVILVLCLMILAIPEGMPLAISIAMAMSVDTMKEDNILIKNIECVQVCALLHEICVGKTGTLTEGKLHVGSYQLINEPSVHGNKWY
jgi:Ca2+-transporting ATPase